jgi:hypothetical protein
VEAVCMGADGSSVKNPAPPVARALGLGRDPGIGGPRCGLEVERVRARGDTEAAGAAVTALVAGRAAGAAGALVRLARALMRAMKESAAGWDWGWGWG